MKQQKSQLKIGVILNYVNMILGNLIPIFYTPIMLALLGQEEYGLYKLSSSVTSYLSLISFGIGSAVTRYLIKAEQEEGRDAEERTLGLFMVIFQAIAILSLIVGTILTLNLDLFYGHSLSAGELGRMKLLVFLMVCNMALSFSQSPYNSVVTAHERFVFLQSINIVTTCGGPLLNLLMLLLGFASVGMAVSTLVITLFCRVAYTLYVRRALELKPRYRNMPTNALKEILIFSFWIFVSNVVSQLYNATDTVMIGAIPELATTGVAVYSVGNTFNTIVFSMTVGLSSLLTPKANKMVFSGSSNEELTSLAIRVGRLQAYIFALVVTGFIAFGRPFIHFYAGEGYEDAYWVAILMMIPNMIPLVQGVCLSIIIAQNKHKFRSLVYLGIAIVNVIGTWLLMQVMGIIGAALMTGIALVIGQGFVMNWYYHKRTGLDMFRFWKEVGCVYLLPAGLCVCTLLLGRMVDLYQLWALLAGIMVYTVVYCVLCWIFSMNDYERGMIAGPLSLIKRKLLHK